MDVSARRARRFGLRALLATMLGAVLALGGAAGAAFAMDGGDGAGDAGPPAASTPGETNGPGAPAEPVDPVDPDPVDPVDPVDPDPVDPVDPVELTQDAFSATGQPVVRRLAAEEAAPEIEPIDVQVETVGPYRVLGSAHSASSLRWYLSLDGGATWVPSSDHEYVPEAGATVWMRAEAIDRDTREVVAAGEASGTSGDFEVRRTAVSVDSVSIEWTPGFGTANFTYEIDWVDVANPAEHGQQIAYPGDTDTRVSDLRPGTAYDITVTPVHTPGWNPTVHVGATVRAETNPTAATLTAEAIGPGTVGLTWTGVGNVTLHRSGTGGTQPVRTFTAADPKEYVDRGLTAGTYTYTLEDVGGTVLATSDPVDVVNDVELTAAAAGQGQVRLEWSGIDPAARGAYALTRTPGRYSEGAMADLGVDVVTTSGCTDTVSAGSYTYAIAFEGVSIAVARVDVVGTMQLTVSDLGQTGATATWTAVPFTMPWYAEYFEMQYRVFLDGAAEPIVTSDLSQVLSGLEPGSAHTVRVEAWESTYGGGGWAAVAEGSVEFTTLAVPAPAPSGPLQSGTSTPQSTTTGTLARSGVDDPWPLVWTAAGLLAIGGFVTVRALTRPEPARQRK